MSHLRLVAGVCCLTTLWFSTPPAVSQTVSYAVTFDDPGGTFSSYYPQITNHVLAAGARWNQVVVPVASVSVEVRIGFANIPTANGRSTTTSYVRTTGGFNIFEQGMAAEVRTGVDPNGATHDVEFNLGFNYLQNQLWFDPNPTQRTASVPFNKTDAMSVFLHEFGHALAFNGWRNGQTGALPGDYMSPYDERVTFDGSNLFFDGPLAQVMYGNQPVPLTFGNYAHVGNNPPRPGSDLIPDLMNGVVFFSGTRYDISPMDWAILADSGVPVTVTPIPEPAACLFMALTAGAVWGWCRHRRSSHHQASSRNATPNPASAAQAVQTMAVCGSGLASNCE